MAITEKYVSSAGSGAHDGSSELNQFSWAEMITDINASGKAGNRYNVIQGGGAISRTTTTDTISGSGSSTSPIVIRGYKNIIGDGYQDRTSGNGALVSTNFTAVTYTSGKLNVSGSWIILECLDVSGAPSGDLVTVGPDGAAKSCKAANSSTNANATAIQVSARSVVFDCDLSLTGGSGGKCALAATFANSRALANRITGGPSVGVLAASSASVVDNLIYASVGLGISMNATSGLPLIYGNTIVGGTTDGIDIITGTTGLQCIVNNCITDNGGYGIDGVSAANAIFAAYNRTRDNTSGADNSATDWLSATKYGQVTTDTGGASTDYTNSGSNDYSLIAASPATDAGRPAYRDIGALQRAEIASGTTIAGTPLLRGLAH